MFVSTLAARTAGVDVGNLAGWYSNKWVILAVLVALLLVPAFVVGTALRDRNAPRPLKASVAALRTGEGLFYLAATLTVAVLGMTLAVNSAKDNAALDAVSTHYDITIESNLADNGQYKVPHMPAEGQSFRIGFLTADGKTARGLLVNKDDVITLVIPSTYAGEAAEEYVPGDADQAARVFTFDEGTAADGS